MLKKFQSKSIAWILIGAFLLFGSPYLVQAQARDTGSISGTIFAKDGTSPYPGAVVTVKDVSTNQVYKSVPTDSRGGFIIDGLPKGVYVFGVSTSEGDFNSDSLIGVEAGKTAKISIALTVFDEKTAPVAQDVYEDQSKDGEALVGRVISFNTVTKMATVFMLRGFVRTKDRIHVKGNETDFFQDLEVLMLEENKVEQVFAGQTALMQFKYNAVPNDLVYVICKKGGFPLFLFPLGIAAIVAGAGAIITTTTEEEQEVSAFRKK
ncbi:MAG: carboxypeptidase-like regulatory domain-containing protein [Acidobacteria bacterium]|nr:carboxypeptidase-like regulatory domain-containing protein [Acidobacteriota bacterium]